MKAVVINRALLVLAFAGIFIAGYLSLAHQIGASIPCGATGGCDRVTNDPRAFIAGIPLAYIGVGAYIVLAALAMIRGLKGLAKTKSLVTVGLGVALIGALSSLYFQYVALMMIRSMCNWCLASALVMLTTAILYAVLAQRIDTLVDAPVGEGDGSSPRETSPAGAPDRFAFYGGSALALLLVVALGVSAATLAQGARSAGKPTAAISDKVELVPADAHIYGDPQAPITIVEFADMWCPACRQNTPKVKEFVNQHPGKVRVVYRHFPLIQKHPLALPSALISEAAGEKGKFWDYMSAVVGPEEPPADAEALFEVATTLGLDAADLRKRMDNSSDPMYTRVERDMKAANLLGILGTPTFVILYKDSKEVATSADLWEKLQGETYRAVLKGNG